MSSRILLSGSHGFVGKALSSFLEGKGYEVVPLIRTKRQDGIYWNPEKGEADLTQLEGFDAVIHLAGKSIASSRWTSKVKQEIFTSRVRGSWVLSHLLSKLEHPPNTLLAASAVGIYGKGFLADLCHKWEASFSSIKDRGTRVVHTRFGTILSPQGGMLARMLPLFKLGLGATFGSGKQEMPWISLEDVCHALFHCLTTSSLEGPVDFVAPSSETVESFSKKLAKALHRPLFLRIGEGPLRCLFGEMADELILPNIHAHPTALLSTQYRFHHPSLEKFFEECFQRKG